MSVFNYKIWPLHENSMLFKLGLSQDTQLGIRFLVMLEGLNFSIVWFDPDQACIYNNPFCAFWACFASSSTVRSFISFQSISRGAPLWGTWIRTLCMKKSRERKKKKAQHPVEVLWHCCLRNDYLSSTTALSFLELASFYIKHRGHVRLLISTKHYLKNNKIIFRGSVVMSDET